MAKDFNDLLAKINPERRARIERRVDKIRSVPLYQLRKALQFTQEQVAEELEIGQAAVSRLERRPDMYLSTLRRFIEAMGGELEIRAHFPEGEVMIEDLGQITGEGNDDESLEDVA